MCLHFTNTDMLDWLRTQIRMLEAWRESVALRPTIDMEMVSRLETHYQWLTAEVSKLERVGLRSAV